MKPFLAALRGVARTVKTERSMRIHLCFAFYVILAGFVTKLPQNEWKMVLLCCAIVISLECVNTAIERTCDAITREHSPEIRAAKDAAAGAVLISAVVAVIIGCFVFFSDGRPQAALDFAVKYTSAAVLIVLTLPVWMIFIFRRRNK